MAADTATCSSAALLGSKAGRIPGEAFADHRHLRNVSWNPAV
jgi:hypothetical protein